MLYQEEMQAFAAFLKEYYFANEMLTAPDYLPISMVYPKVKTKIGQK